MSTGFYPTYPQGRLHPDSEAMLRWMTEAGVPQLSTMAPADARKAFVLPEWLGAPAPGVRIVRAEAGGVPVRLYVPRHRGRLPVLVYLHGGGFVIGSLDEFEPFCTQLAAGAHCLVVSVDYRLAPEHPFPAALDDAWTALRWVAGQASDLGGDPFRLAVAGDSAGGNLAAVIARLARDLGGPALVGQVLLCPWVDLSDAAETAASFGHFGQGLWLNIPGLHWYRGLYLGDRTDPGDDRISPLRAADFRGLPPVRVFLAEFDPLADQGRDYAERLRAAGVPAEATTHPGTLHDFMTLPGLFGPAREAIDQITAALRDLFA